jgi:diguanylate cyclase (GGDEF)-like protein
VSDRDVLRELVPGQPTKSAAWQHKTVESVMVTKFMATTPKAHPNDVVSVLVDGAIQCLPILEEGKLVGVMTPGDLLFSWNRLRPVLQQAGNDPLTGLANRATFNRRLAEELERARRQRAPLSLLLCDVDHFKKINDTCGHLTGDAILTLVANCLRRHLRQYDVLARFGGDEFAAICTACGREDIEAPVQRVQEAIRSMSVPMETGRRELTISIGTAVFTGCADNVTPNQLIHAADECLYQAKAHERGSSRIVDLTDHSLPQRPDWLNEPTSATATL